MINLNYEIMDEIYTLSQYFPLSSSDPTLRKYLDHHLNACIKCGENELYSSVYAHLHILYMTFVYIQLLRIAKEKKQEFGFCWIGFPSQEKDFLKDPSSPFSFSKIQEKTVFRFFRLAGFDDGSIGNISEPVKTRNARLHAKGELFFENKTDFEREFEEYIKRMNKIIEKQKDFLEEIYNQLIKTFPKNYEITQDDIETDFSTQCFFSIYELRYLAQSKTDEISKYIQENF